MPFSSVFSTHPAHPAAAGLSSLRATLLGDGPQYHTGTAGSKLDQALHFLGLEADHDSSDAKELEIIKIHSILF
jgi:hypothetical protein